MGEAKRRKLKDPNYGRYSQAAKKAIEALLVRLKEHIRVDSSGQPILAVSDNKLRGYSQIEIEELKKLGRKTSCRGWTGCAVVLSGERVSQSKC